MSDVESFLRHHGDTHELFPVGTVHKIYRKKHVGVVRIGRAYLVPLIAVFSKEGN